MPPAAPADLPLVVSLTTLPSRIGHLAPTLESLQAQTRRPNRILLCLPRRSRREGRGYDRPAWLADHAPTLEVVDCEDDWGPGTKLLGCLGHLRGPSCLVVVDDDMRYRPSFLEQLHAHQIADVGASFSYWTFRCGPIAVGQGADGFSFYSPNLDGLRGFANRVLRHPQLHVVDDLWISAYLLRRGVAVKSLQHLLPGAETVYEATHSVNQLRDLTGDLARDEVMLRGTRFLLESGLLGRRTQAVALLKKAYRTVRDAGVGPA